MNADLCGSTSLQMVYVGENPRNNFNNVAKSCMYKYTPAIYTHCFRCNLHAVLGCSCSKQILMQFTCRSRMHLQLQHADFDAVVLLITAAGWPVHGGGAEQVYPRHLHPLFWLQRYAAFRRRGASTVRSQGEVIC